MGLALGSTFGAYRIVEPLGRGGMASVYKAYEAALDRYVALKVLPAEFLHETTFAERFEREAKVVARLEHPNIIPIFSFGIEGGIPWMAMRLIPGGSLAGPMREGRIDPARAVAILGEAANALDYAHAKGVVHRDVKPQNILLDDHGRVYLADFGIAKMVEASSVLTQTGMISGTPQYMAPEQAVAGKVDERCDVYALGIVAYEMLVGRTPFSADTPVAILLKQVSDPIPVPPPDLVPEPLLRPILKCLAKHPADRWPKASAFARALSEGLARLPPSWQPEVPSGEGLELESLGLEALETGDHTPHAAAKRAPTAWPPTRVAAPRGEGRTGIRVAMAFAVLGLALAVLAGAVVWMRSSVSSPPHAPSRPTSATSAAAPPVAPPPVAPATMAAPPRAASAPPSTSPPRTEPTRDRDVAASRPRGVESHAPLAEPTVPAPAAAPESASAGAAKLTGPISLDVDAAQDPYGPAAVAVLHMEARVDGRSIRRFSLSFTGEGVLSRSRKRQQVDLGPLPAGRHRITVLASEHPDMGPGSAEASTDVTVEPQGTRLVVQVRELSGGAREIRLR